MYILGTDNTIVPPTHELIFPLALITGVVAEALIATAMGLFAAIPAVMAYNRFTHHVEKLENSYGNFMEEFSSILQRQTAGENRG